MKYTLLELTQAILTSMKSDEVNSIGDTTESQTVAALIKQTYFDITARQNIPKHYSLFQLDASLSTDTPTLMTIPDDVETVEWIKYSITTPDDPTPVWSDMVKLSREDFLHSVLMNNPNDSYVTEYTVTFDGDPITLMCRNDTAPQIYSVFSDGIILFDAYDLSQDDTLKKIKTMCYGQKNQLWQHTDNFVPDLDDKSFQLLLNEAKSLCFAELKNTQHAKAEQTARRLWIDQMDAKTKLADRSPMQKTPNYGRK